jgi:dUTP pyrophosphatase
MRKFEYVNRIKNNLSVSEVPDIKLPKRSTTHSAGYDFYSPEDVFIPGKGIVTYVKTGVKAKMQEDEFLMLCNRSSNPKKKELVLINGVGVVDSDYYSNPDNDGEICFAMSSLNEAGSTIKKGEKIGQGIFLKYYTTEDDSANGKRSGVFGSTGK